MIGASGEDGRDMILVDTILLTKGNIISHHTEHFPGWQYQFPYLFHAVWSRSIKKDLCIAVKLHIRKKVNSDLNYSNNTHLLR